MTSDLKPYVVSTRMSIHPLISIPGTAGGAGDGYDAEADAASDWTIYYPGNRWALPDQLELWAACRLRLEELALDPDSRTLRLEAARNLANRSAILVGNQSFDEGWEAGNEAVQVLNDLPRGDAATHHASTKLYAVTYYSMSLCAKAFADRDLLLQCVQAGVGVLGQISEDATDRDLWPLRQALESVLDPSESLFRKVRRDG